MIAENHGSEVLLRKTALRAPDFFRVHY